MTTGGKKSDSSRPLRADPDGRLPRSRRPSKKPKTPKQPKKAKASGRRTWPVTLLRIALVLAVWAVVALAGVIAWFAYDLPDPGSLHDVDRRPSVTLLSRDGAILATFGDLYGEHLPIGAIAPAVRQALIATEDRRFYSHFGIDPIGLGRAVLVNLANFRLAQGGSTVTQQLAKNVYLSGERSLRRKVQELLLALWLEHRFTKDQILELYLNRVYFGAGAYGIEAAAQRYFAKSARNLTVPEAAMLVGLLRAPSRLSPTANLAAAQARAGTVIANMQVAGYLTPEQAQAARDKPAKLAPSREPARGARYFADYLLDELNDIVGSTNQDVIVQTTLDARLQQAGEKAIDDALTRDGERLEVEQGALMALAPDGAIRAMIGGRDYRQSPFNRATQARREPGSAFKLFVFLAGLEAGFTPETPFVDKPVTVRNWTPRNYEGTHMGEVSFRTAVARSINTVAVQISERVGRERVIDMARRLGVSSDIPSVPAIALGAVGVSLLEMTAAYDALANGGLAVEPYGIVSVKDRAGQWVYRRPPERLLRVLDPRIVAEADDMLSAVIAEGTGRAARLDRPAAGKTGTSSDYRDASFIGYTADLTAGVWVGNDDASAMVRVTGGGLPAQIWKAFMTEALKGEAPKPLTQVQPPSQPGFFQRLLSGGNAPAPAAAPSPSAPPRSLIPPPSGSER